MPKSDKKAVLKTFFDGIIRGIGWSFGATIGFAIISTLLVVILSNLGGLPVVGKWLADIVEVTLKQLATRSIISS